MSEQALIIPIAGTEESWLELYWDMEPHIAEFRLHIMEEETPIQLWEMSVPIPKSAGNIPNTLKLFPTNIPPSTPSPHKNGVSLSLIF